MTTCIILMYGNAVYKARGIFQKVGAVLVGKFGIKGIGTVEADVAEMMAGFGGILF